MPQDAALLMVRCQASSSETRSFGPLLRMRPRLEHAKLLSMRGRHSQRAISVNTLFSKILVTRVKRKIRQRKLSCGCRGLTAKLVP
jgi:hypothetical protein